MRMGSLSPPAGNSPSTDREDAARWRLLKDMGVDVWYLRAPPQARAQGDAAGETASKQRRAEPTATRPHPAPVRSAPAAEHLVPAVAPPAPASERPAPRTALPHTAPFSVLALGMPAALFVVEASGSPANRMLAKDVLRSATRNWTGTVAQAQFNWPQPGASGVPSSALAAFVEKQANDFGAKVLLISSSAAQWLGDCPPKFVKVPDMASLTDAERKRRLWRQLQDIASG